MNMEPTVKSAIVTGASHGIGKSIAFALAELGIQVIIADVDFHGAECVAKEITIRGYKAIPVKVDVSNSKELDNLVAVTVEHFGKIDILINNAGICPRTPFEEITEEEWDKVLATNLKSVFLLSQKTLPHMKNNRSGRIVNIASVAGKMGGIQVGAHYSASKAAVICLTKTLALYCAKHHINVNAVCPGVIETEITTCIPDEQIRKYKEKIPVGQLGSTEDVANAVLFLVSDKANYITGEILDVNGGLVMD